MVSTGASDGSMAMALGGLGPGGPSGAGTTIATRAASIDFPTAWNRLHQALRALVSGEKLPPDLSGMALYSDVYHICTTGGIGPLGGGLGAGRRLYEHVRDFLSQHCVKVVASLQQLSSSPDCTAFHFLSEYTRLFIGFTKGMEEGAKLLAYLDRLWITKHHHKHGAAHQDGVMSISELVPLVWRQVVLDPHISELLRRAVSRVAREMRDAAGPAPQPEYVEVLKAAVESYVVLGRTLEPQNPVGFYKEQLEDYVLADVFNHYAECASVLVTHAQSGTMDEGLVAQYIRLVERCIAQEQGIWNLVHASTSRGAIRVVRKSMLESEPHHEILMAFAKAALAYRQERLEDLNLLYRLLDNDDVDPKRGIDALRQIFLIYVRDLGSRQVKRGNDEAKTRQSSPQRPDLSVMMSRSALPADYVSSEAIQMMLDLYSHYLNIVKVTFMDDTRFSKAFKKACESFINHLPNMAESLAIHTHYFLDKNCPDSRTEHINVALDQIILLFNFLQDKDLFQRCYAQLLATRVINSSSVSDEAEHRMMKHLRQVCGFSYAMSFQRMFMDKALSTELSDEFQKWLKLCESGGIAAMDLAAGMEDRESRDKSTPHHPRRKSDSSIDYVETGDGRVTPRTLSPTKLPNHKFMGLHESSPLQMLLSKRVFANKMKQLRDPLALTSVTSFAASTRGPTASGGGDGHYFFGEDEMDTGAAGGLGPLGFGISGHLDGFTIPDFSHAPDVQFFAFVLTGGSWPYQQGGPAIRLPLALVKCVETFSAFYDAKYKRRRLAWLHELGHGEVVARCYDRGHYTLHVSTYQMAILDLFNHTDSATLEAVCTTLDLDLSELVPCLYPLVKAQLLVVSPPVGTASELCNHHTLAVNLTFTRRSSRVVVSKRCEENDMPVAVGSPRHMDPGRISPGLLNERKGAIEAKIVNVMKKAGTLRHDKLIEAVFQHTRRMSFVPPTEFVVEVVRSDIDKDFLEVIEDGPNPLYRYVS